MKAGTKSEEQRSKIFRLMGGDGKSVREEENKPKEGLRMWRELTTQIRKKVKPRCNQQIFLKKEQKSLMRPSSRCSGRDQSTGDSGQNPQSVAAFREQLQVITSTWSRESRSQGPEWVNVWE